MEKKKITKRGLARKCKQWEELTEWNCHGECIEDIARYFGLKSTLKIFKAVNTIHNEMGCLPVALADFRYEQFCGMFDLIKAYYGEDIAQRVRKCC